MFLVNDQSVIRDNRDDVQIVEYRHVGDYIKNSINPEDYVIEWSRAAAGSTSLDVSVVRNVLDANGYQHDILPPAANIFPLIPAFRTNLHRSISLHLPAVFGLIFSDVSLNGHFYDADIDVQATIYMVRLWLELLRHPEDRSQETPGIRTLLNMATGRSPLPRDGLSSDPQQVEEHTSRKRGHRSSKEDLKGIKKRSLQRYKALVHDSRMPLTEDYSILAMHQRLHRPETLPPRHQHKKDKAALKSWQIAQEKRVPSAQDLTFLWNMLQRRLPVYQIQDQLSRIRRVIRQKVYLAELPAELPAERLAKRRANRRAERWRVYGRGNEEHGQSARNNPRRQHGGGKSRPRNDVKQEIAPMWQDQVAGAARQPAGVAYRPPTYDASRDCEDTADNNDWEKADSRACDKTKFGDEGSLMDFQEFDDETDVEDLASLDVHAFEKTDMTTSKATVKRNYNSMSTTLVGARSLPPKSGPGPVKGTFGY